MDKQKNILQDELYQVETPFYVAGFVVRNGFICECAPILREKTIGVTKDYLLTISERIGD